MRAKMRWRQHLQTAAAWRKLAGSASGKRRSTSWTRISGSSMLASPEPSGAGRAADQGLAGGGAAN